MANYTVQGHCTVRRARKGEDGTNAVHYYLVSDIKSIPVDADGNAISSSATVTVCVMKQVGSGDPVESSDCPFICYTVKNSVETLFGPDSNKLSFAFSYGMINGEDAIRIKLFSTTNELIDTLDISAQKPGENAIDYKLLVDAPNINQDTDGNCTPSTINVKVRKTVGNTSVSILTDLTDTGLTLSYPTSSGTANAKVERLNTITGAIPTINAANFANTSKTIELYNGSTLIDSFIVTYTTDGEQGIQGIQGCILRVSEWTTGVEYHNDEALTSGTRFLDIAVVTTDTSSFKAYKCLKTHTSSSDIPCTNTTYWEAFNNMVPIYTPLLLAENALIRLAQTNQIVVTYNDKVVAGIQGNPAKPIFWITNPDTDASIQIGLDTTTGAPYIIGHDQMTEEANGSDYAFKIDPKNGVFDFMFSNMVRLSVSKDGFVFSNGASKTLAIDSGEGLSFAGQVADFGQATSGIYLNKKDIEIGEYTNNKWSGQKVYVDSNGYLRVETS